MEVTSKASFQDEAVSVYRDTIKNPSISAITAIQSKNDASCVFWEATWSQRDLDRNTLVKYKSTGNLCKEGESVRCVLHPASSEILNEKIISVSNNGDARAILREVLIKETKTQFLEIWNGSTKVSSTNLTAEEKHGVVHSNDVFSCMEWSQNDDMLLYVAEKKVEKSQSFFKKPSDKDVNKGNEYVYREEWGEQLIGCSDTTIVLFNVKTNKITPLDVCLPDGMCASEALWLKDDKKLIVLGWQTKPWRLGLIYCKNRPSALYEYDLQTKTCTTLTDLSSCVFSPRLSPDLTTLIYLESNKFGPHQQCAKLMGINLDTKAKRTIVDIVPQCTDPEGFQGLFLQSLPKRSWYGNKLICSSVHCSNTALISIDIESGRVDFLVRKSNWTNPTVCNDLVFACYSSPSTSPILKVGSIKKNVITEWFDIDTPGKNVPTIKWHVMRHTPEHPNNSYPNLAFESILLKPVSINIKGLIINPHGGPHSCFTCAFDNFSAGFCQLGYAVLRVNYRGSIGFGQNSIYSLLGNLGTQDVKDVYQAACAAKNLLELPSDKIFVHGGSHGGFLTLHLIGQYPGFFAASAVRNPVSNIATMSGVTDIPDWCVSEPGGQFKFNQPPSEYDYKSLMGMSPIKYIPHVKSPLLLMIGANDLRVPPSQGMDYCKRLRAFGGVVRLLKYDGNDHPIAEVVAEADCFVNMALWFFNTES